MSPPKAERQGSGRASPGMSTSPSSRDEDDDYDDGGLAGTPKVKDLDTFAQVRPFSSLSGEY